MRRLAVCLGLVVTSFVSAQTDISSSWRGDLKTGSGTVTLLLDLTRQEGGWIGTIGVPQSGLSGLELDSVTLGEDGSFGFEFSLDEASFEGMATGSEEQRVIRGTCRVVDRSVYCHSEGVAYQGRKGLGGRRGPLAEAIRARSENRD